MMRYLYLIFFFLNTSVSVIAQPAKYTVANIHAHNDYQYNIAFEQAHRLALGSVEVDLVLLHDTLFVAHAVKEIERGLLFENAYLQKISNALQKNNNYVFADSTRVLQLLIDIKTDSLQTLDAVIRAIRNYPALIDNPSIRFVITGRQPPASQFKNYPSFIFFDGNINNSQHLSCIDRIGLFSDNFKKYTQWNGKGVLTNKDLVLVKEVITKAHQLGKPIRFWAAPDNINTWYQMMELGIDYINTDHITEAAQFMNTLPATTSERLARQDKKEILIQLSGWVKKTDEMKTKKT